MIQRDLQINSLLPLQVGVYHKYVNMYAHNIEAGKGLDLVHVLSFPGDENEQFILLDGHHKAKAAQVSGFEAVHATVYMGDEELAQYLAEERARWGKIETKDAMRNVYRTRFAPDLGSVGIVSIATLPEFIEVENYRPSGTYTKFYVDRAGKDIKHPAKRLG